MGRFLFFGSLEEVFHLLAHVSPFLLAIWACLLLHLDHFALHLVRVLNRLQNLVISLLVLGLSISAHLFGMLRLILLVVVVLVLGSLIVVVLV